MSLEIRKISLEDGHDIYEMLQEMLPDEDGFINAVAGKPYDEYKKWLNKSVQNSEQKEVIDGWKVPQTTFWLLEDGVPVGFGKIRHFLTDKLLEAGGNVGYAIRPSARKRGLGTKFLGLLLEECRKMEIDKVLLTIRKYNVASKKVALANGGKIEKESEERYWVWIDL